MLQASETVCSQLIMPDVRFQARSNIDCDRQQGGNYASLIPLNEVDLRQPANVNHRITERSLLLTSSSERSFR